MLVLALELSNVGVVLGGSLVHFTLHLSLLVSHLLALLLRHLTLLIAHLAFQFVNLHQVVLVLKVSFLLRCDHFVHTTDNHGLLPNTISLHLSKQFILLTFSFGCNSCGFLSLLRHLRLQLGLIGLHILLLLLLYLKLLFVLGKLLLESVDFLCHLSFLILSLLKGRLKHSVLLLYSAYL